MSTSSLVAGVSTDVDGMLRIDVPIGGIHFDRQLAGSPRRFWQQAFYFTLENFKRPKNEKPGKVTSLGKEGKERKERGFLDCPMPR
jgi:hypothetical protein